jgi:hypothetical protein
VCPLLASGDLGYAFQEPPEVFAPRAVSFVVSLPPGKARLRRRLVALSDGRQQESEP